jgi:hypothetical protein
MKVKHLKQLLDRIDDDFDLYIETSPGLNQNCFYSSAQGAKIKFSEEITAVGNKLSIEIRITNEQ